MNRDSPDISTSLSTPGTGADPLSIGSYEFEIPKTWRDSPDPERPDISWHEEFWKDTMAYSKRLRENGISFGPLGFTTTDPILGTQTRRFQCRQVGPLPSDEGTVILLAPKSSSGVNNTPPMVYASPSEVAHLEKKGYKLWCPPEYLACSPDDPDEDLRPPCRNSDTLDEDDQL
jgi:hypothetical protein